MDIYKTLGFITKLPASQKVMSNFEINCSQLSTSNMVSMKKLHTYILDCEDFLSVKHVDWYEVILGLIL